MSAPSPGPYEQTIQGLQNAHARERERDSLLHTDDYANEKEMGVGAQGLCHYPLGCALPGEGELSAATLLKLLAGNKEGDPLREFVVEGNRQWAKAQVA